MFLFPTRPNTRSFELLARADYIVQKLRSNLPPSSLWHEKRFAKAQLEAIAIVSTGGLYDIFTFDSSAPDFHASPEMFLFSDLGISVDHIPGSRKTLEMSQIKHLVLDANHEFDQLNASDKVSAINMIRRVTVTIDFSLKGVNYNDFVYESFEEIAHILGLDLTYIPYITRECWLPESYFYDATFSSEYGRSAAEFVFPELLNFDYVESLIKSSFTASGTIRAPGIHVKITSREQPFDIHFVSRAY